MVAKEMMATTNQLLQLNMGEGKLPGCRVDNRWLLKPRTSVIVPMLVASLADGDRLLRITVLSSLRRANAADWQLKFLGNMPLCNERLD